MTMIGARVLRPHSFVWPRALLLLAAAPVLASCGESLLPCVWQAELDERTLEVRRIADIETNAPIGSAVFSDFTVDGRSFQDGAFRVRPGPGTEVIDPNSIRCSTPCKFGGDAGLYGFLVSADGFEPKRVEYLADWMHKSSGCPVVLSGATVVEIPLERAD